MSAPDDRVPGIPIPRVSEYRCPVCGKIIYDEMRPECPDDGTLMELAPDPYAERRRRLREGPET